MQIDEAERRFPVDSQEEIEYIRAIVATALLGILIEASREDNPYRLKTVQELLLYFDNVRMKE